MYVCSVFATMSLPCNYQNKKIQIKEGGIIKYLHMRYHRFAEIIILRLDWSVCKKGLNTYDIKIALPIRDKFDYLCAYIRNLFKTECNK